MFNPQIPKTLCQKFPLVKFIEWVPSTKVLPKIIFFMSITFYNDQMYHVQHKHCSLTFAQTNHSILKTKKNLLSGGGSPAFRETCLIDKSHPIPIIQEWHIHLPFIVCSYTYTYLCTYALMYLKRQQYLWDGCLVYHAYSVCLHCENQSELRMRGPKLKSRGGQLISYWHWHHNLNWHSPNYIWLTQNNIFYIYFTFE